MGTCNSVIKPQTVSSISKRSRSSRYILLKHWFVGHRLFLTQALGLPKETPV